MTINDFNPEQTTPFSFKHKIRVYAWKLINKTIFRIIPNQIRRPRIIMLNLFGAKIANNCYIHRNANIESPWNLTMGNLSHIGENCNVQCLNKIVIEEKCTIGRDCRLLTGSHNIDSLTFEMTTKPIIIKSGTWLTTGVSVMPGVVIGEFSVAYVNSLITKNIEPFSVIGGSPAQFIRKREIKNK